MTNEGYIKNMYTVLQKIYVRTQSDGIVLLTVQFCMEIASGGLYFLAKIGYTNNQHTVGE